jgi:hypothetical protein
LLEGKEAKEMFLEEVMALFIIEIYSLFESWEGAPEHQYIKYPPVLGKTRPVCLEET